MPREVLMASITPEQRQLVERAGGEPVRLADDETKQEYVILRADVFDRMRHRLEVEEIDPSYFEIDDFEPVDEDPR
jgi:hypothetical protein